MNSQKSVRKSVTLPNSRWAAYAVAGAATSLAGLASAEAEIHYSGHINHRFTGSNHASFPLQDGARLVFSHQLRGSNRGSRTSPSRAPAGRQIAKDTLPESPIILPAATAFTSSGWPLTTP